MRLFLLLSALGLVSQMLAFTLAVAANAGYAAKDLIAAYRRSHSAVAVRLIVGSSGKLTAQIRHGAPFDLFLSADMRYPSALAKEGYTASEPIVYARGRLALLVRRGVDVEGGLMVLASPSIRRIAVANPETAPYGRAALEALHRAGLYGEIEKKIIYAESVGQALTYALRAADAGIVALSSLRAPGLRRLKEGVRWVEVPPHLYHPTEQGAVLLRHGKTNVQARAFFKFLKSPEAQTIFQKYGYSKP